MRTAPGIESAGAHVGRAITSDEIVDVNAGEIWLTVAPGANYNATLAGIRDIAVGYPGVHTSVRTYAEDRVAAAQDKVGDELVVRVYGADLSKLRNTADDVASMLSTVTGVLSPRVEPQVTQPTLQIEVNLAAAQRHGLRPGEGIPYAADGEDRRHDQDGHYQADEQRSAPSRDKIAHD